MFFRVTPMPTTVSRGLAMIDQRSLLRSWSRQCGSTLIEGTPNPQLERIFDYYLRMVWQLSLAIPAPYVSGNPFDLPLQDKLYLFEMPQPGRATPAEFELTNDETIRMRMSIGSAAEVGSDFAVLVDDLRLARPLVFADLPETSHAVKKPILVVGRYREEFGGVPPELTGGPLEFEAYLMWAPKIAPTEHQGVLVRVHGSSGTLFDPTFLRYQVSEQTRLRQISCEIFVSEGLEAALNIDRESFNYAHPHVVYITKWLHASLRRVATVQKRIAAEIREATREAAAAGEEEALSRVAARAWQDESDDLGAEPPPVEFAVAVDEPTSAEPGAYRFRRGPVFGEREGRRTRRDDSAERKLRTIVPTPCSVRNPRQPDRPATGTAPRRDAPDPRGVRSMTKQPDGQDDLTSGIFGDFEYVLPQTEPKEFKPWHKPRKQFVRRAQLSALLRRLYEKRGTGGSASLPGPARHRPDRSAVPARAALPCERPPTALPRIQHGSPARQLRTRPTERLAGRSASAAKRRCAVRRASR